MASLAFLPITDHYARTTVTTDHYALTTETPSIELLPRYQPIAIIRRPVAKCNKAKSLIDGRCSECILTVATFSDAESVGC